jgi:large subunit ribosomal protein L23
MNSKLGSVRAQERLLQIILAPQITEKATRVADDHQQIAFRVRTDSTKPEIKLAVELMFKVQVESVTVVNVGGKEKRAGRVDGRRKDWKKAYVSLKPGQEINFAAGE